MSDETLEPEAPAIFVDKWRTRWPEWRIAEVFVARQQRTVAVAWFALLEEWTHAAWSGDDATPGLAKLAWWNEELLGWAKGARRHPLGEALMRCPVAWPELAATLRRLQATRHRAVMDDGGDADLDDFARAVADAEARWSGEACDQHAAMRVIADDLRCERALSTGDTTNAASSRATAVVVAGAVRARRIHAALQRARLESVQHHASAATVSPFRILRTAWRAARAM